MIGDIMLIAVSAWAGGTYVGYRSARRLQAHRVPALLEAGQWPWKRL